MFRVPANLLMSYIGVPEVLLLVCGTFVLGVCVAIIRTLWQFRKCQTGFRTF